MAFGTFPRERMNPNGGSVALGHPFGATGARILGQLSVTFRVKVLNDWRLRDAYPERLQSNKNQLRRPTQVPFEPRHLL